MYDDAYFGLRVGQSYFKQKKRWYTMFSIWYTDAVQHLLYLQISFTLYNYLSENKASFDLWKEIGTRKAAIN